MPVTFQSKSHASITMMNDVSLKLLKMMGHSGTVPGAIRAEDLQSALEELQKKLDAMDDTVDDEKVSLKSRAYPLIGLLRHATAEDEIVMWDYY